MIERKDLMIGNRFFVLEENNLESPEVIITKIAGKTVETLNPKNKEVKQIPIQNLSEIPLKPGELGFSRRSMKINGEQLNDWVKEIDSDKGLICVLDDSGKLTIEGNVVLGIRSVHKLQSIIRILYGTEI